MSFIWNYDLRSKSLKFSAFPSIWGLATTRIEIYVKFWSNNVLLACLGDVSTSSKRLQKVQNFSFFVKNVRFAWSYARSEGINDNSYQYRLFSDDRNGCPSFSMFSSSHFDTHVASLFLNALPKDPSELKTKTPIWKKIIFWSRYIAEKFCPTNRRCCFLSLKTGKKN